MATRYLGGISNLPMAEGQILANACQGTCRVSWTWPRRRIKQDSASRREKQKCTAQCTSSTKVSPILSSFWPSSSFEVVANEVFCGWCGYIPHVCRNEQWWTHRNAAQIPGFTKSLYIHNHTHSGRDRPKSYSCKSCSNNSEILGIEWAAAGICTSCTARAKMSPTHMVTDYRSRWLWSVREWSPPTLPSRANESTAWLDTSTEHYEIDDIPDSGGSWGPYKAADREWRHVAVWWTVTLGVLDASSRYSSLDIQAT